MPPGALQGMFSMPVRSAAVVKPNLIVYVRCHDPVPYCV